MSSWTFMIYMAGDNNLSPAAEEDLAELRTVGSTAEVRVLVEVDRAGDEGSKRYRIERDGRREEAQDLGETDSGDPSTVLDFVRWASREEPSERFALVLWNHGGGWEPSEIEHLGEGAPDFTAAEARERAGSSMARLFFRSSLQKILRTRTARERAILSDDGSGHSLDTVELGRLLIQIRSDLGRPLDLLGMDACLMSNLEVAYELRNDVQYIVASEEIEPGEGWPYAAVLQKLTKEPAQPAAQLAATIVREYADAYSASALVTQAALDLGKLEPLLTPLDALADAAAGGIADRIGEIWEAQFNSARFYDESLWDLLHFASELRRLTTDSTVARAAEGVCSALQPGNGPVIAEAHHGARVARCGGVSAYLPALTDVSVYYPDLAFARDHRWLPFLRAYRNALRPAARPAVPPTPPSPPGPPESAQP
jgi:Clostripain family